MLENQLSMDEVKRRLALLGSDNSQILEEIYSFGQVLVRQVVEDIQNLDSKAAAMAAYAGGIVTLLVSSGVWSTRIAMSSAKYGLVVAGVLTAISAVCAVRARTLQPFDWFSQSDWLRQECLENKNHFLLKQFRVVMMWQVINSWRNRHERKAKRINVAQYLLAASVCILAISLLGLLLKVPSGITSKYILGLWRQIL